MNYREEKQKSQQYKINYVNGLNSIIEERQNEAEIIRKEYAKSIFENQEKYRNDFKKMLGWPLVEYEKNGMPAVETEKLSDEKGYSVYRMQFEILKGLKMTGLFFRAEGERKPLVIVQHGGWGTPELISGIYGSTENYNEMLKMVVSQGVHAFAPQLLLWSDDYEVAFDRCNIDARLKRVGSSITAIEIHGISSIIDYFENQDYVTSFGMVGLSYGGFYTLYTSAVDTRIKSAVSCSFFNKRDKCPWSDWTWQNSANIFDDAEVACLVYPRKICLEMGNRDELFEYKYSVESFEKIKEMCSFVGTEWISLKIFDGVHEFCTDYDPICKLVEDIKKFD